MHVQRLAAAGKTARANMDRTKQSTIALPAGVSEHLAGDICCGRWQTRHSWTGALDSSHVKILSPGLGAQNCTPNNNQPASR
jgi:hypothetical protein